MLKRARLVAVQRSGYRAAGTNAMLSSTRPCSAASKQFQAHAQGDLVVGTSNLKGVALSTDGTKALKQKAEDRYGQAVGLDQISQMGWSGESRRSYEAPGSGALIRVDRRSIP